MAHEDLLDISKIKLIVSENCPYLFDLRQKLREIFPDQAEDSYLVINNSSIHQFIDSDKNAAVKWIRDFYFINQNNELVFPNLAYAEFFNFYRPHASNNAWRRTWQNDPRFAYTLNYKSYDPGIEAIPGRASFFKPSDATIIPRFKQARSDIEGGNLIQAINTQNEIKGIVGISAVLNTGLACSQSPEGRDTLDALLQKRKDEKQGISDQKFQNKLVLHPGQSEHLVAAKYLCEEDLGLSHRGLVVIPQWIYHIDCILGYLGRGKIILHSFTQSPDSEFTRYCSQFEPQIAEIERKLVKHHFEVIRCCGLIGQRGISLLTDRGEVKYEANFMNGFAVMGPTGQYYYFTNDTPLESLKSTFTALLLSHNIQAVYLNIDADSRYHSASATMYEMTAMSGGLRCQTNFIDINSVTNLSFTDH